MIYLKNSILILSLTFFNACVPADATSTSVTNGTQTISGDQIIFTPNKSDEILANPYKGFVSHIDDALDNYVIPMTVVFDDVTWADLEPVKGQIDWNAFEAGWAHQVALGRKVGFRFKMVDPWIGGDNDIPQWLINEGVSMRPYSIDGGTGNAPDWDNEKLLTEHARLLNLIGNRYNNDPRIAWIDIGSYGIWGEWHVYQNEHLAATDASKQRILNDYFTNLPNKKLVIAFDDSFATNYVTTHGSGIRNDCLGQLDSNQYYLDYMKEINPLIISDIFKNAVVTGEFCGGTTGVQDAMNLRFTDNLNFIKNTHWSFIGPSGGELAKTNTANTKLLHKTLGYHLSVTKITHEQNITPGGTVHLNIQIANEGVAPFYYAWPLEITLKNAQNVIVYKKVLATNEVDIRLWNPGNSTINFNLVQSASIVAGDYKLGIAVLDPNTGTAGLKFANTGIDVNGRYFFSKLTVKN